MIKFGNFCRERVTRFASEFTSSDGNFWRGPVTLAGAIACIALFFGSPAFAQPASSSDASTSSKPAAGAAATEDATPSIKKVSVADRWSYEMRDEISGEVKGTFTQIVTDISPKEISLRVKFLGKPGFSYLTYDHSWNLISNGHWKTSPNDGTGIREPLSVGKKWRFRANEVLAGKNVNLRSVGNSKVVARTSLSTEAGTFDTFEIDTSYTERNSNDPTKRYKFLLKTWYAPSINHWVKREQTLRFQGQLRQRSVQELIEYEQNG